MKFIYLNSKLIFTANLAVAFLFFLTIQVKAQTNINAIGVAYIENFNSLTPANTWSNGSTPNFLNWYALGNNIVPSSFILNDGNNTTLNSLSSFGSVSQSDRAFGFVPGGANGIISYYGWRLRNNMSSTTIRSIAITWTLEQWRRVNSNSQSLTIYYQISPSPITSIVPSSLINSGLQQASPQFNLAASSLDGNLTNNRVTTTHNIEVNIAPGSEIIICWGNTRVSVGNGNHLLAIDDVSIVAKSDQSIENFEPLQPRIFGDADFSLNATATSNLPVTYASSNLNVATITGNTVSIKGPGDVTITAMQAGNQNFSPATNKTQVLSVYPSKPVISAATNTTQNSFTANWTANNGLRDQNTIYGIDYTTDKEFFNYDVTDSNIKTKVITGLLPNQIYYYRLYSITDEYLYSELTESSAITTGTNYVSINNGNWDVGSNWDVGTINNIANSIKILHDISLATNRDSVITNTLWITSTGKLTTNQKIHVTNQLIIEVDQNGVSGQIINSNNIHVGSNAIIKVRKSFGANAWNFMGFPFMVTASNVFAVNTSVPLTWGNDYVVYEYSGSLRNSTGQANTTGQGLNWVSPLLQRFEAKKGYIIATPTARTIDFTVRGEHKLDIFNTNSAVSNLGVYSSNSFAGHRSWNLVTSPFFSPFELRSTSQHEPYYIFNALTGNYWSPIFSTDAVHPDKKHVVYPFQAFFIQARGNSMNFSAAGKQKKIVALERTPVRNEIYLKLSNGNVLNDDEMRIRMKEDASLEYVQGEDAAKMFGLNPAINYIYSSINGNPIAVNSLPITVTEVDVETKFTSATTYTITLMHEELINSYAAVMLLDKLTGKSTDLLKQSSYNFNVSQPITTNRFRIQLMPKVPTRLALNENNEIYISTEGNSAKISGLSSAAQVTVYDVRGCVAYKGLVENNSSIKLENKGLYIFEIKMYEKKNFMKVFIN